MEVPSLDDMRRMSDSELLHLRTDLSYDASMIESQIIAADEEGNEEWRRRASGARNVYQRGLSSIKNILAERSAEYKKDRIIPLTGWVKSLTGVADAAALLMEDDSDENWSTLEAHLDAYEQFCIDHEVIKEAL